MALDPTAFAQAPRSFCLSSDVLQGMECNTDHSREAAKECSPQREPWEAGRK